MNILHITAHMGDGVGKAIGGMARLGSAGEYIHKILVLDSPKKRNHIDKCLEAGVDILWRESTHSAIADTDVVIINWWGHPVMDEFLSNFPKIPCRVLLWAHVNGCFGTILPDALVDACGGLLATNPMTLENPKWSTKGTLVWGFGEFTPDGMQCKTDYAIKDEFTVGYIGYTGYKRFPENAVEYFIEVLKVIPECRFVLAGEPDSQFMQDVQAAGIKDNVTFLGWIDNAHEKLREFDVFGYLTKPDIFAATENSVLEAMATGLPVALSRRPLGKYLLEDNISGFLFDNPKEYADIIKRFYDSEDLRRKTGENARVYTITQRDPNENMTRFIDACKRIMKSEKHILQEIHT